MSESRKMSLDTLQAVDMSQQSSCGQFDDSEGVLQLPICGTPLRMPKQCLSIQAGEMLRGLTGKYLDCNMVVNTTTPLATPEPRVKSVIHTSIKPTPHHLFCQVDQHAQDLQTPRQYEGYESMTNSTSARRVETCSYGRLIRTNLALARHLRVLNQCYFGT